MFVSLLGFGFPGVPEMMIVLAVFLLLFGATKLPGLARSMGQSINEFKRGMNQGAEEYDDYAKDEASKDSESSTGLETAKDEKA